MESTTESTQPTGAGAGNQPSVQQGTGTQPDTSGDRRFTQDEINAILAREKKQWRADEDTKIARARQQADDEAKAKQGEFQALADQRATKITELEAKSQGAEERLTAISEAMEKQAKARMKALPEEIRAMAPEGDVLALYTWLEKAEAAAAKLGTQAPRPNGTPPGPRGTGAASVVSNTADLIAQKRASGDYSM